MKKITENQIDNFFNTINFNYETTLCGILSKYGSDKCSDWHNYSQFYNFLFEENHKEELNIFEVGILFGSSIRAWSEYFENSKIFCGDFNSEYFINEKNIKSFYCNQDDTQSILDMWKNETLRNILFDIIIDDGKHEFSSNCNFLVHSYHKLKEGGIFIVEDLTNSTYNNFQSFIEDFKRNNQPSLIKLLKIENPKNKIDNNLLIIQK